MKMFHKSKKGIVDNLKLVAVGVMLFLIIGVIASVALLLQGEVNRDLRNQVSNNTSDPVYQATVDATTATTKITSKLPLVATIFVIVIILLMIFGVWFIARKYLGA